MSTKVENRPVVETITAPVVETPAPVVETVIVETPVVEPAPVVETPETTPETPAPETTPAQIASDIESQAVKELVADMTTPETPAPVVVMTTADYALALASIKLPETITPESMVDYSRQIQLASNELLKSANADKWLADTQADYDKWSLVVEPLRSAASNARELRDLAYQEYVGSLDAELAKAESELAKAELDNPRAVHISASAGVVTSATKQRAGKSGSGNASVSGDHVQATYHATLTPEQYNVVSTHPAFTLVSKLADGRFVVSFIASVTTASASDINWKAMSTLRAALGYVETKKDGTVVEHKNNAGSMLWTSTTLYSQAKADTTPAPAQIASAPVVETASK